MSSGLTGNWGQVNIHIRNLQRAKIKERPLESIAQVIAAQVRRNIESQALDFAPLSEDYLARKVGEGYDERILIRTSEFVDRIVAKDVQVAGDTYVVEVGVEPGQADSGIDYELLAQYLEHGTVRMPGRYPFLMTWEAMKSKLKQDIVQQIMVELREG